MARTPYLDRWARTLGVTNDDDALQSLSRLEPQIEKLAHLVCRLEEVLREAPDGRLHDELNAAKTAAVVLQATLMAVRMGFRAHRRGGGN